MTQKAHFTRIKYIKYAFKIRNKPLVVFCHNPVLILNLFRTNVVVFYLSSKDGLKFCNAKVSLIIWQLYNVLDKIANKNTISRSRAQLLRKSSKSGVNRLLLYDYCTIVKSVL